MSAPSAFVGSIPETYHRLLGPLLFEAYARDIVRRAAPRAGERVLELAAGLSHDLGAVYGMVRRLDDGAPHTGDSPAAAWASIDELWGRLRGMRRELRTELGAFRADSGR